MKDEPRQRLSDDHMAFARLDGEIETHQRGYLRTPGTGGIDQARRCDRPLARQHSANGPLLVALHSDDLCLIEPERPVLSCMLHPRSTRQPVLDLPKLQAIC